jgi:lipid-binding SYLF domain-containing protein
MFVSHSLVIFQYYNGINLAKQMIIELNHKKPEMKNLKFFKFVLLISLSFFIYSNVKSQDKQEDKITASTKVLQDFGKMKENIPAKLMDMSEGIIIVPKLINGGFVIAAKRGRGIAMTKLADGTWSNPVFVTITGGSIGLQAGVQSVELVLIFKHRETLEKIGKGSFTLGGDISATAGPVGRNSTASTDYKMEAEVYSYSRSKGLFAGISLSGAAIDVDQKANTAFYGNSMSSAELFSSSGEHPSPSIIALKHELNNLHH